METPVSEISAEQKLEEVAPLTEEEKILADDAGDKMDKPLEEDEDLYSIQNFSV
ncbi:MAG: hypothetical protein V4465_02725 [Patescibacteria group bacterium]